jgi:hypothetical protein
MYCNVASHIRADSSKQLQEVLVPALQPEWTVSNEIRIVNVLYAGNHKPVQIKYVRVLRGTERYRELHINPVAYH